LKDKVKLKEAGHSAKDMFFTIEKISCLGASDLVPVFLICEAGQSVL
jgi:NADH:ubiquinone oxidoreductase subunit E